MSICVISQIRVRKHQSITTGKPSPTQAIKTQNTEPSCPFGIRKHSKELVREALQGVRCCLLHEVGIKLASTTKKLITVWKQNMCREIHFLGLHICLCYLAWETWLAVPSIAIDGTAWKVCLIWGWTEKENTINTNENGNPIEER